MNVKNQYIGELLKEQKKLLKDARNIEKRSKLVDHNVAQLQYLNGWLTDYVKSHPEKEKLAEEGMDFLSAIVLACSEDNKHVPPTLKIHFDPCDEHCLYITAKVAQQGVMILVVSPSLTEKKPKMLSSFVMRKNDEITMKETSAPEKVGAQFILLFPNESIIEKAKTAIWDGLAGIGKNIVANAKNSNKQQKAR